VSRLSGASADRLHRLALIVGLLGLPLVMLAPQRDPDAWWHLLVGAWIVQHGAVPHSDVVSWWSAGTAWISPSWLNEVLLVAAHQVAGPTGQSWLYLPANVALVVLVDRCLALVHPRLLGWQRLLAIVILWVAIFPVWAPRAGSWDLVFALFAVWGWLRLRATGSALVAGLMVPAAVLWANLHGGGITVLLALALAFGVGTWIDRHRWAGMKWRPFGLSVGATVAAFTINPYGLELLAYPWPTLFSAAQSSIISEWLSPDLDSPGWLLLRLFISAGLVVGLARARQPDTAGALMAGGMLFAGLGGARLLLIAIPLLVIWYLPPAAAGAAALVRRAWPRPLPSLTAPLSLYVAGVLALAIASLGLAGIQRVSPTSQEAVFADRYPTANLDLVRECDGRTWTDYGLGGWVAWHAGRMVGPYGGADALGDARLQEAADVERLSSDPATTLDRLDVQLVVSGRSTPLAQWLSASTDWQIRATDATTVAAARVGGPCAGGAD
jgi:hypothetical protein